MKLKNLPRAAQLYAALTSVTETIDSINKVQQPVAIYVERDEHCGAMFNANQDAKRIILIDEIRMRVLEHLNDERKLLEKEALSL